MTMRIWETVILLALAAAAALAYRALFNGARRLAAPSVN
jgi:hypothetical protein